MPIGNQVCSLELSKKLLSLGVKQNSYFYWRQINSNEGKEYTGIHCPSHPLLSDISAFSVYELMELLPPYIDTKNNEPFNTFGFNLIKCSSHNIQYICNYHCDCSQFDSGSPYFALKLIKHNIYDENLADCLAKTLIYLIEEGFV